MQLFSNILRSHMTEEELQHYKLEEKIRQEQIASRRAPSSPSTSSVSASPATPSSSVQGFSPLTPKNPGKF